MDRKSILKEMSTTIMQIPFGDYDLTIYDAMIMNHAGLQLPHKHPYYELHLLINGDSNFIIDDTEITIQKGQLCWINPGHTKTVNNNPHQGIEHFVTHFYFNHKGKSDIIIDETEELKFFFESIRHKAFWVCNDSYDSLAIVNRICIEMYNKDFGYMLKTRNLLSSFIVSAIQNIGQQNKFKFSPKHDKFTHTARCILGYIRDHYQEGITLTDAAKGLNISSRHVARVMQDVFGTTFSKALISFQVENAKIYLCRTDYSIEHIAELVGLSSRQVLNRHFKNITAMTAAEYRKSMRQ